MGIAMNLNSLYRRGIAPMELCRTMEGKLEWMLSKLALSKLDHPLEPWMTNLAASGALLPI
jgi:hypothetical protein